MRRMFSENQIKEIANEQVQEQVSTGELENVKVFENIIDKDGHKRFIEGDIEYNEIVGVAKTYAKWSLSGTHLMIVCCGTITNATEIPYATTLCSINLPQWIKDKIVILLANVVEFHSDLMYNLVDVTTQQLVNQLRKTIDGNITITIGAVTMTADRSFRIEYDLLIDNESEE